MTPYIAAAIGFVTAAVLAMINTWLTGRAHTAEEVRARRVAVYPSIWRRTGVVSRWPRTNAEYKDFVKLHEDLRHWYYADGGIYLSTQARKRYEHFQLVLEAVLARPESDVARHYESLMEAASYFRTGLTQDLATRDRPGSIAAILAWWGETGAQDKAKVRLRQVRAQSASTDSPDDAVTPVIHQITREEEQLSGPDL